MTQPASNPVIVVEVLSPSTQSISSSDKLADYFRVPVIQHYLIVRAKRRGSRSIWRTSTAQPAERSPVWLPGPDAARSGVGRG